MATTNNISIIISAKDDASATLKQLGLKMGDATESSNKFSDALGRVRDVALGVVAANATTALANGFKSMLTYSFDATRQVQQYVAGIKGLTDNSAEASSVIKGMVDYVQGKPFDRIEVLGAARNLLVFGDSATQTQKDIELLGRAVTISGSSWDSLSQIFGRVRSSGRLMTDDFNQLMYAGVNIGSSLSKNLGVSMTDLRKKLEAGTITFDQFRQSLEDALPADAVAKSSNTIDNRVLSLRSSFRNLGFAILGVDFGHLDDTGQPLVKPGGLLDLMSQGMEKVTALLKNPNIAQGFASAVRDATTVGQIFFQTLSGGTPVLKDGEDKFASLASALVQARDTVAKYLTPSLEALWHTFTDRVLPVLNRLWHEVLEPLMPVIATTFVGALRLAMDTTNFLLTAFTDLANFLLDHKNAVLVVSAAFGTLAASMALDAAFNSLTVGFATFRLVTIPSFIASLQTVGNTSVVVAAKMAGQFAITAVKATASAAVTAAGWIAQAARVSAAWLLQLPKLLLQMSITAVKSAIYAADTALAWTVNAVRVSTEWVVLQMPKLVASFAVTSAKAVVEAATTSAAWVASAAKTSASWVITELPKIVTSFIATAASATLQAAVSSAAWVASAAKSSAAWVITELPKIILSFITVAASAVANAATASAAWVAAAATSSQSFAAFRALVASPVAMGSIAVAGAIADIALVTQAVQAVRQAIKDVNDEAAAVASSLKAQDAAHQRILDLSRNGTPDQKARAQAMLKQGFALGTNYAPGGVAMVGERGPELVQLPQGSKVYNAAQTKQMTSGGPAGISIGEVHVHNDLDVKQVMSDWMWRYRLASRTA